MLIELCDCWQNLNIDSSQRSFYMWGRILSVELSSGDGPDFCGASPSFDYFQQAGSFRGSCETTRRQLADKSEVVRRLESLVLRYMIGDIR